MKHSAATPLLILVGLTLLFLGATIDLLGNLTILTYRTLQPSVEWGWTSTLHSCVERCRQHEASSIEYLSRSLETTGERLESYFYLVDNSSGSIPSVADAFYCALGVDLGKLMKYIGEVIRKAFE